MSRRRKSAFKDLDLEGRRRGRRASFREVLTDEMIAAEVASMTERALHDLDMRGLYVRIRPSGSKTFAYRQPGIRRKNPVKIGDATTMSVDVARAAARKLKSDRELGRVSRFASGGRSRLKVGSAFDIYRMSLPPGEWSKRIVRTFQRLILPKLGDIKLSELSGDMALEPISVLNGYHPASKPHYIFSAFLTWARRHGHVPFNALAGRASLPRRPQTKSYWLDAKAIGAFWRGCDTLPEKWGAAFRLMIASERSIQEVLSLPANTLTGPWPDDERMWRGGLITDLLSGLPQHGGNYLFMASGKRRPMRFQQRYWNLLRETAGYEYATMRDLRKSVRSEFETRRKRDATWDDFLRECMADSNDDDDVVL